MDKIELLEMKVLGTIEGYLPKIHYEALKERLILIFKEAKKE